MSETICCVHCLIDYATTEELEETATTYSESADELFMRNAWPDAVCECCQELEDKCSCDNLGHLWNPHCEERCCL